MPKIYFKIFLGFFLTLCGCQSAPAKHWDRATYGQDRMGGNMLVADPLSSASDSKNCDLSLSGRSSEASWETKDTNAPKLGEKHLGDGISNPERPGQVLLDMLLSRENQNVSFENDAKKLVEDALEIYEKTGLSVFGRDTCAILNAHTLPSFLEEVDGALTHLREKHEFCPLSFAGVVYNHQVNKLGRTPEGALRAVSQYESCALGPKGLKDAARELADPIKTLKNKNRKELNPEQFQCSR